ncbi:MFS transporter [Burkholderia stagnalis]|uniref:MFS transporter n=1 Tax=Burkholderia stagnalis TaxID=1503054 RepID=UPI000751E605|nr:MFS transporter [Burkholderia stagnalis]KVM99372.1 MFS transporter [Burkholderia stagnalis]KWD93629.1 MFS transporter [Burkholderia stagnalis]KWE09693.1 MFS transporter [Burkholderia stagnalis]KWO77348.1 MFS transporter [Burkholderia stagnalis]
MTIDAQPASPRPAHHDRKMLVLSMLGGALEVYDFIIFFFFAVTLSRVFFPPDMPQWLKLLQSFGIFATGYLARPLGGIWMAHFADRSGRKRVFSLTVLLMALPCFAIGIMPTYAQIGYLAPLVLLAMRILQGAAVGGEVPSAWAFVAEHARSGRRGYVLGMLQAGLTLGYLLGALTGAVLERCFSPAQMLDYGWRIPFILGGLFGLVGVWMRRRLSETPRFLEMQGRRTAAVAFPLREVIRAQRSAFMPAVALTAVLTSAVVVLVIVTPTFMQQRFGLSARETFAISSVGIVFLNIGCVIAGLVVDRIGAWKAVALYSALLPVGTAALYASLAGGGHGVAIALAYAFAGLLSGVVGAVPSVMVALFSTAMRVSGISFTYNLTYAIWASAASLALVALMPASAWVCVQFTLGAGVIGVVTALRYGRKVYFGDWHGHLDFPATARTAEAAPGRSA